MALHLVIKNSFPPLLRTALALPLAWPVNAQNPLSTDEFRYRDGQVTERRKSPSSGPQNLFEMVPMESIRDKSTIV